MGKSGSSKRQGLRRRITKPTGIRFESQARLASLTQSAALGEISVPVSIAALRIERGVLGVSYNGGEHMRWTAHPLHTAALNRISRIAGRLRRQLPMSRREEVF